MPSHSFASDECCQIVRGRHGSQGGEPGVLLLLWSPGFTEHPFQALFRLHGWWVGRVVR